MDFGFSEEQDLLRAEVRKYLDEKCPLSEVRAICERPDGFSRERWKEISELGWLGLTIPEAHGGAGLGWIDLLVVLEEAGRSLFPLPLAATTLAAAALREAGSEAQQARWLPLLADGSCIGTLALLEASDRLDAEGVRLASEPDGDGFVLRGEKLFVPDAGAATLFVVAFRTGAAPDAVALALLECDAPGLVVRDFPGIDLTRRLGGLSLDGVRVRRDALLGAPGSAAPVLARLLDRAAVAVTAEAVGAAEAAVALCVKYAKERVQFGSPIGRYQGVKHPLAEMHVDVESWKSLLYYATWCLDESPEEAPRFVSMAKAYQSEAFARIGIDAVQLHGAVGYTWEYDVHLYLKRAKWARAMYGDADWHYERVAKLGGL
jgi:acyl-CoA dehydrogenase